MGYTFLSILIFHHSKHFTFKYSLLNKVYKDNAEKFQNGKIDCKELNTKLTNFAKQATDIYNNANSLK